MSYQVIARKWRPQTFDEIIGQSHIATTLKNAIKNNRVGHAFLFTGVRGVGKTTSARILAKALNCENLQNTNPCGVCKSCIDIQKGTHIDVVEIDGASNTSVDDVKVLRDASRYLPSQSKYKIYIIDEVHMLSEKAFNALLKTLEEPPAHVKFIFATTDQHKIPITIKSRCQIYDFKSIPLNEIAQHLKNILDKENISAEMDALYVIARKAEGSMRDAQSLTDQVIAFAGNYITKDDVLNVLGLSDNELLFETTNAILTHNVEFLIEQVELLIHSGINLIQYYKELINHFHNILIVKTTKSYESILKLPKFEVENYINQTKLTNNDFFKLYEMLIDGFDNLKISQFQRITFELNLIKLAQYEPITPLKDILSILEKLNNSLNENEEIGEIPINIFQMSNQMTGFNPSKETQSVQNAEISKVIMTGFNPPKENPVVQNAEISKVIMTGFNPSKETQSVQNAEISKVITEGFNHPKENPVVQNAEIENIKLNNPDSMDLQTFEHRFKHFFEKNGMLDYFFRKVSVPLEFNNDKYIWLLPSEGKTVLEMYPDFTEKFTEYVKSIELNVEIIFNDFNENSSYEKQLERIKKENDLKEIELIKNSKEVQDLQKKFNLTISNIKRSL